MSETFSDNPTDEQLHALSSVNEWIKAVDLSSRESLVSATDGWTQIHSDLLLRELERQIEGTSVLAANLDRVAPEVTLQAITLISESKGSPILSAMVAGLLLIART